MEPTPSPTSEELSPIPSLTSLSTASSSSSTTSPSEKLLRETLARDARVCRRRSIDSGSGYGSGKAIQTEAHGGHRRRRSSTSSFLGFSWLWGDTDQQAQEEYEDRGWYEDVFQVPKPFFSSRGLRLIEKNTKQTPTKPPRERSHTSPLPQTPTPTASPRLGPRHSNSYPSPLLLKTSTTPSSTPRRKFTLGLETVPSISDLRAASSSFAPSSATNSNSLPAEEEDEGMLTPPPTPPTHSHIPRLQALGLGQAPIKRRHTTSTKSRDGIRPRAVTGSLPGTPLRAKYAELPSLGPSVSRIPVPISRPHTPTSTPQHTHRRALSVQVPGIRRTSQTTPSTPQRGVFPLPLPLPTPPSPGDTAPVHHTRVHRYPELTQRPNTPNSASKFNARVASETCRRIEGMVSFANVEGLGEPSPGPEGESGLSEAESKAKGRRWLGLGLF
ncbi:hypothetical protein VNI00_013728 [Paramarasmius palmivorus]|uniref:Uncharacterized protein n=1 Tax=Paramarasmius palmivorus TaxID=297713 RepID=A0AAW0BWI1_9AGAR